ncbi:response regulator [Billgrantia pellis]|uniref:Response regulator n=1 Tax=Billgrantia pellis TaxID=2606936 RepID=A0A7V7G3J0_9GAMM|nr:response regulator [Halomonas pellis]KAA0012625.1 response regulator [Halomonas pellis]
MPVATRKDRFWSFLVWPLLWPLLLAQAALVLLCLLVGLVLWLATPAPTSWAETGWLLLALLIGTTLTTTAFLMQLRYRIRDYEAQMTARLSRIERLMGEAERWLPHWLGAPEHAEVGEGALTARLERLQERLTELQARLARIPSLEEMLSASPRPALLLYHGRIIDTNVAMEQLLGESPEALTGQELAARMKGDGESDTGPAEVRMLDAEGRWRPLKMERLDASPYQLLLFHQERTPHLGNLVAARERAREDSRLKSHYLTLLQRELEPLLADLGREMEKVPERNDSRHLANLRERMADVVLLVGSLAGDGRGGRDLDAPDDASFEGVSHLERKTPLRVLVVDDGPVNRMLARQVLEGRGFRVDSVSGGQEALERQQRQAYDLVLMDIFMPDMDGVEVARRWREQESQLTDRRRSVLVALTANATESDRRRFHEAGMDDYLAKPYGPRALLDLLRRWRPDAFEETSTS